MTRINFSIPLRRAAVLLVSAAALLIVGRTAPAAEPGRPNIVFLLADDMGWRDSTLYGSTFYETPNVDRLARRGMTFTNAYSANPLCSPTRASILTGQYPGRLRFTTPAGHLREEVLNPILPDRAPRWQKAITPQTRTRLPLEYYTLAEALRDAGYATAHLGKWHLGWAPYQPENQGFDFNLPGGSYPGPPGGYFAPFPVETLKDCKPGEHIDDRLTREAVRFMKEHKDRPFFLNYWFFSVHAPFQAKEDLIEKYRAKADESNPQHCPTMGGMLQTMDECVGRILDAIDSLGLARNTIIVFTSDNGGNMYNEVDGTTPTNNCPLRGGKATIYEGGTRVPLIVVWPGRVEPGSKSDAIVSSIDYYPTLLEMIGRKPKPGLLLDGISIVPALLGQAALKREALFCHFPHVGVEPARFPATSVRQGKWKLIRRYCDGPDQSDRFELYNLEDDLGEAKNLADAMPEKVKELNALISRHLEETKALVPVANPAYRPAISGWSSNDQATLARLDGCLVMKCTGGDPQLVTQDVPAVPRPATLELRMQSDTKGSSRVYWATKKERPFHRNRSVEFEVAKDRQWRTYTARLGIDAPLISIRVDPLQSPGEVRFESMRLIDADGKTLREWRFDR